MRRRQLGFLRWAATSCMRRSPHPITSLVLACGLVVLTYGANWIFNHTEIGLAARDTPGLYVVAFYLGVGVLAPALLLRRMLDESPSDQSLGLGFGPRELLWTGTSLGFGAVLASFPLAGHFAEIEATAKAVRLFAGLLVASTAEVLVFTGVLFSTIELALAKSGRLIPSVAALTISSLAFGFFHLTYPAPWNSVATCLMLTGVWAGVSLVFLLSRSLLAAIAFNNVMALIGFMQRDLVLPVGTLVGVAAFVAGLGMVAAIARRSDTAAQQGVAADHPPLG